MDLTSIINWTAAGASALLAQAGGAAPGGPGGGMAPIITMMIALAAIYFVMVLRPQRQEQKKRQELLDTVGKGDRVVTNGGIHGTVEGVDAAKKTVSVTIAPKTTIVVEKWALTSVTPKGKHGQDKDDKKSEETK